MKVLGLMLLGLMISSCCCDKGKTESKPSLVSEGTATPATATQPAETAKPKPAPPPAMSVQATTLYKEYEQNEVAADDKYKDKALLVSGTVHAIDKDFMNNIVLKLSSGDPYNFSPVHATLEDSEKSKAAKLSKGEKVTLRCIGGTRIIKSPTLKSCTVQ